MYVLSCVSLFEYRLYVCMYVCMYICMYVLSCVSLFEYRLYGQICLELHTYTHMHTHTYHTSIPFPNQQFLYLCQILACANMSTLPGATCIHTYIHIYIHTYISYLQILFQTSNFCIFVRFALAQKCQFRLELCHCGFHIVTHLT